MVIGLEGTDDLASESTPTLESTFPLFPYYLTHSPVGYELQEDRTSQNFIWVEFCCMTSTYNAVWPRVGAG